MPICSGTDCAELHSRDGSPSPPPLVVGLDVLDVEVSARFYRDILGLPLEPVEEETSDPWSKLRAYQTVWGGGRQAFALWRAMPGGEARGVRIGFAVRDLNELHRRVVAAGADVLHPPRREAWGRLARYRDPDGNIVGVSQFD
jgi:predicted enzyme related to lactoylglutathione lyase